MPGVLCRDNNTCQTGERCISGRCGPDPCRDEDRRCAVTERCGARCVPLVDPCRGVRCDDNETCLSGRCVAGCFLVPCAGVQCPTGQFCDVSTGACTPVRPCDAPCPNGSTCHVDCFARSPCDGIQCASTEYCVEGQCVPNPCASVMCPARHLCVEGRCIETCGCDTPCDTFPNERCVAGQCVCTADCSGANCGDNDGCGGRCTGPCAEPSQVCDRIARQCVCTARCTPSSPCGSDDGCGGRCATGCPPGTTCDPMRAECVCTPECPELERVPCGELATATRACPGVDPSCGRGRYCPPGLSCDGARCVGCQATCPTPSVVACNERPTTCDPTMRCPGIGTACAPGYRCTDAGCVCDGTCEGINTDLFPCGTIISNPCPTAPPCGYGTGACARGQRCDAVLRRCTGCTPTCPPGAECDQADGCGGHCVGSCPIGRTCARSPVDPTRFQCALTTCPMGCPCGQICAAGRCVSLCGEGQQACNCTTCCLASQYCGPNGQCLIEPP